MEDDSDDAADDAANDAADDDEDNEDDDDDTSNPEEADAGTETSGVRRASADGSPILLRFFTAHS